MKYLKNIYMIIGESGCGKSTVQQMLCDEYNLRPVISYTTRKPRYEGEKGHIFVSKQAFAQLKDMVAYTEFDGHEYCATTEQVDNADLYIIDVDGVKHFRELYKGKKDIKIIYINSPMHTRMERMEKERGFDSALQRIKNDVIAFKGAEQIADCIVVNGDNDTITDVVDRIWEYIEECETE